MSAARFDDGPVSSSRPKQLPTSVHSRVARREQASYLRAVVERVANMPAERDPVVVFDLDGTLIDNRPRSSTIMHELAELWRGRHPEIARKLAAARPDAIQYLFRENLRACGVCDDSLFAEAVSFWRARFFTDEFLCHDVPVAGALRFARHCYDAGARLCYFTGRDLPNMALGSLASLRDLGFPIAVPGTELVLKPSTEISDYDFKRKLVPALPRSGVVVAAFDNEPGNCNLFRDTFSDAEVFLVDTQHLPGAPELARAVRVIADFSM